MMYYQLVLSAFLGTAFSFGGDSWRKVKDIIPDDDDDSIGDGKKILSDLLAEATGITQAPTRSPTRSPTVGLIAPEPTSRPTGSPTEGLITLEPTSWFETWPSPTPGVVSETQHTAIFGSQSHDITICSEMKDAEWKIYTEDDILADMHHVYVKFRLDGKMELGIEEINRRLVGECSQMAYDQGKSRYQLVGYGHNWPVNSYNWACFVFDECVTWDQQNFDENTSIFKNIEDNTHNCAGNYQFRSTYWGDNCLKGDSFGCVQESHIIFAFNQVDTTTRMGMWADHGCHVRALMWKDESDPGVLHECESLNNERAYCPMIGPN